MKRLKAKIDGDETTGDDDLVETEKISDISETPKITEDDPPAISFEQAQLNQLSAENSELRALLMEMKNRLMPDPVQKKKELSMLFDKKMPFAKHRGLTTGVYYEQNGRKYNGKFELVK